MTITLLATPHTACGTRQIKNAGLLSGQDGSCYEILKVVGKGGLGIVYQARRKSDGTLVALKMTQRHDPIAAGLLEREFRILDRMRHPSIVNCLGLGKTIDGEPYLIMEYVPGVTLQELLRKQGPLAPQRANNICRQVAEAIQYAHRLGVIHRDLKPGNIMITRRNGQDHVSVLDFGISKGRTDREVPLESGSVLYLAPEQLLGKNSIMASDVYQLGLIWFECLTGHLPFDGNLDAALMYRLTGVMAPKYRRIFNRLPQPYNRLLQKMLHKNPRQRLNSMPAFLEALNKLQITTRANYHVCRVA